MSRYKGKMVAIDGEKLNELIEETGKSISKISRELGHSDGVLRMAIKRGTLAVSDAVLLESKFKIKKNLYVLAQEDEEETEVRTDTIFTEDVLNSLHKVIYSAVYSAFKKALEE